MTTLTHTSDRHPNHPHGVPARSPGVDGTGEAGAGQTDIRAVALIEQEVLADWLDLRLSQAGMRFLGRIERPERLVEEVEDRGANLVISEATLPGDDPIALIAQLHRARPEVACFILSKSVCGHQVGAALNAGASGVFTKNDRPEEILSGLRRVRAGELAFGSTALRACPSLHRHDGKPRASARDCSPTDLSGLSRLTPREREVFSLMGQGLWRTDIASKLCRSPKTIDKHRASIMKKLDLHDHAALVLYAVREGLVDPSHSGDARVRESH